MPTLQPGEPSKDNQDEGSRRKSGPRYIIATDIVAPENVAEDIGGWAGALDVTQEGDWADAMACTRNGAGGLDILVNNAGVLTFQKLVAMSLDDWRLQAVNVEGVFLGRAFRFRRCSCHLEKSQSPLFGNVTV